MMEYLLVKDMSTGKSLQILGQPPNTHYIVIDNVIDLASVKKQSLGKIIRDWMKEVRSDNY